MITQKEENNRVLNLLAEHYQKGRSETIEKFEKIIRNWELNSEDISLIDYIERELFKLKREKKCQ